MIEKKKKKLTKRLISFFEVKTSWKKIIFFLKVGKVLREKGVSLLLPKKRNTTAAFLYCCQKQRNMSIAFLYFWRKRRNTFLYLCILTKSDTALPPHFPFSRWPEEEWTRPHGELYRSSGFGHPLLSKLLKECQIRQLWLRFQILVTFTMGLLRFLRLNGPVVSEFAFWTSPK